jgi:hypothetical protein
VRVAPSNPESCVRVTLNRNEAYFDDDETSSRDLTDEEILDWSDVPQSREHLELLDDPDKAFIINNA